MTISDSASQRNSARQTLKLKAGPRQTPTKKSDADNLPVPNKPNKTKPGAHWSDEYRQRMQQDMDLLTSRRGKP